VARREAAGTGVQAVKPARKRARAIARGRGGDHRVVIPLAFELAARISARPGDTFRNDPTQLANGLGELQAAIDADGIVCALSAEMELASSDGQSLNPEIMTTNGPVAASLEACRRLRTSHGDAVALLAGLTGPMRLAAQFDADIDSANKCFTALVKAFCEAGTDVILVFEQPGTEQDERSQAGIKTAANIASFHQSLLFGWSGTDLPRPVTQPLDHGASTGIGIITTDDVVNAEADIEILRRWVAQARGA